MFFQKFWRQHRTRIFVFILFLIPFAPFVFRKIELPRIHFNDLASSYIVHPVANILSGASSGLQYIWDAYFALVKVKAENEKLLKEVAELKNQLTQNSELHLENNRLKTLLSIPELENFEGVGARIIGEDASAEAISFYINAGHDKGIKPRMPVITPDGAAGSIKKVFARSSVFVSVLDPSHTLDGIIQRSRARMIIEGMGAPLLGQLKYLDRSHDIKVGDLVLTSGLDGVFPKGLLAGFVIEVNRPRHGVLQSARLRAAVDPGKLEEVLVLKYQNPTRQLKGNP